jgi:hypothetical protein
MTSGPSPFPAVDRVNVSPERIAGFKSDRDYLNLGLELMIEAGSYITIAATILRPDGTWTRDQAAIGGNMVRLYKLFSAMLDQTVQRRQETSLIFARLAFETIIVILYMLQEYDPALFDEYVKHSLDYERRLLETIAADARSGMIRPIVDRMRRSINRMFESSGIALDELPAKRELNWGGKNLYEKAKAIGLADVYLLTFANTSQNVHGAWGDLYAHHLSTEGDGCFTPNLKWTWLRPQPLYAVALLSLGAAEGFALFMGGQEVADFLVPRLNDLRSRLTAAVHAHESYLAGKSWPEI